MDSLHRFENIKVVVTGAADGIGRATATRFAAEGASVLAADQNADGLAELEDQFETLVLDVTQADAAELICSTAEQRLGGMDVLVNNAGVAAGAPLGQLDDELWERVLDINLNSVFKISRRAIGLLSKSGRGRIVNIGSVMSVRSSPGMGAYAVSKHGVAGLTRTLALELGELSITANYIQPGAIVTGISRDTFAADENFRNFWIEKAAMKRLGQPEDIAAAICFLASSDAGFITGHGLTVDGGALQSP